MREEHSCRDSRPLSSVTRLLGLMHFPAQHVEVARYPTASPTPKPTQSHSEGSGTNETNEPIEDERYERDG